MRFRPRGYQRAAIEAVAERYAAGHRKLLLHLPTGAGKTVVGAMAIERLRPVIGGGRTLFVAHRQEILDQTARVIGRQLPRAKVGIEQGARAEGRDAEVVIASVQSLLRRKEAFRPSEFGLIVCDECHHALAPSWAEIIDYFHTNRRGEALLLGMTATPRRTDGRSASHVFNDVAFEMSRAELQDLGYLVPMRYFGVQAGLQLQNVSMTAGDFQVGSLSATMNTAEVRALTLRAWQQLGAKKKTIAFCAGVTHATQLAADFEAALGVRAAVIDARTSNREQLLQSFRSGQLRVLTNYGVLTEGFDDPAIECVLMARPTTSPLVYTQCIGRGLRPAHGKTDCTVIDIVDRSTHQLQYTASEMAGLPRSWRSRGRDPFREQRSIAAVRVTDPDAFLRLSAASCLEDVQSILAQLPPEAVLAGLDGQPVLRYDVPSDKPTRDGAKEAVRSVLRQTAAPCRSIVVDDDSVTVRFAQADENNERYGYLRWHLERVSHRQVRFRRPYHAQVRRANPRAVLRSMLPTARRIGQLSVNATGNAATVAIENLPAHESIRICEDFEAETGIALHIQGQMALGF
jgi:superfamily II DNA or RNA helicase